MIAIVLPSNIEKAPYVQYYIDIYESKGIDYKILFWNRDVTVTSRFIDSNKSIGIVCKEGTSSIAKFLSYLFFVRKVKKIINELGCSSALIFTIQLGLFLQKYLNKKFKDRYIFDIRDYSPILKYNYRGLGQLVNDASLTVISSEGFKNWLPKAEYILSHNIRSKLLLGNYKAKSLNIENKIILTIGQIRDYRINRDISCQIKKSSQIKGLYCGYGNTYDLLKEEFSEDVSGNFSFYGRYEKEEEAKLVLQCDFVNAITPNNDISKDLTSNRFYLTVLYKRPIIVLDGTHQAELVRKYRLGIVLEHISELENKLDEYIFSYDVETFNINCDKAKIKILEDIKQFEQVIFENSRKMNNN